MQSGKIIYDLPADAYHADPALGSTMLCEMRPTPLHFWARNLDPNREPRKSTAAMDFGTDVHMAMLEPEKWFASLVLIPADAPKRPTIKQLEAKKPSDKTLEAIAWWAAFDLENAGKIVRDPVYARKIDTILWNLRKKISYRELFSGGKPEVSLFWEDAEYGTPCKIRIDWFSDLPAQVDVKTTRDASAGDATEAEETPTEHQVVRTGFARQAENLSLAVKAAHYIEGVRRVVGIDMPLIYVAIENDAPFDCVFYEPDEDFLAYGRRERDRLMRLNAACAAAGKWPGYPDRILPLGRPRSSGRATTPAMETY